MKKPTCLLLALLLLLSAALLAACRSNNSGSETASAEPTVLEATEAETTAAGHAALTEEQLAAVEEKFDSKIDDWGFRGFVMAVRGDQVIYEKASAPADEETGVLPDRNTVYCIGSVTKQFTAAGVLLLQERGLLSVSDTIDRWFPEFDPAKNITIHHLLTMRSGIADYTDFAGEIEVTEGIDVSAFHALVKELIFSESLHTEPGMAYEYSNSNYFLLAEIIEQVSGESYHDFIRTEIFDKIGMTSSGFVGSFEGENPIAVGYGASEAEKVFSSIPDAAFGAGDILSTAADLLKWANALRSGAILSAESFDQMTTPEGVYACGVMVSDGGKTLSHAGNFPPFTSFLLMTLDDTPYTEIMLCNYNFEEYELGVRLHDSFRKILAK